MSRAARRFMLTGALLALGGTSSFAEPVNARRAPDPPDPLAASKDYDYENARRISSQNAERRQKDEKRLDERLRQATDSVCIGCGDAAPVPARRGRTVRGNRVAKPAADPFGAE